MNTTTFTTIFSVDHAEQIDSPRWKLQLAEQQLIKANQCKAIGQRSMTSIEWNGIDYEKSHPLKALSDSIKLQLDHSQTFTLQTLTSRPFLSLLVLFGLSLSGSYAAASPQCDIKTIYKPLEDKTKALEKQTRATLGSRPGMRIDNVLWVGKGQYQLICNGRYPSLKPISRSNGPAIDHRTIKNWTRGDGKASGPGRYIFQDKSSYKKIPILPMNHERIAEFGVKVASDKDILNTPESSVLATYD